MLAACVVPQWQIASVPRLIAPMGCKPVDVAVAVAVAVISALTSGVFYA